MKVQTGASCGSVTRKDNPPKAPSRAFQMTSEEAKATADVVSGTFPVNSLPAHILFDSGIDRSFIRIPFANTFLRLLLSYLMP